MKGQINLWFGDSGGLEKNVTLDDNVFFSHPKMYFSRVLFLIISEIFTVICGIKYPVEKCMAFLAHFACFINLNLAPLERISGSKSQPSDGGRAVLEIS